MSKPSTPHHRLLGFAVVGLTAGALAVSAAPAPAAGSSVHGVAYASTPGKASYLSVRLPAGGAPGDVLLAGVSAALNSSGKITAPSGWSLVRRDSSRSLTQAIYFKVAGAAEPSSYRWSFSPATTAVGSVVALGGMSASSPIDISSGRGSQSTGAATAPSITTSTAGDLVFSFFATSDSRPAAAPGGYLQLFAAGVGGKAPASGESAYFLQLASGPTGDVSAALPAVANASVGQLVAVRPAAATAPPPPPDFAVSLAPSSLSLAQGGTANASVSLNALNGFAGTVSLAVNGLPAGVTGSVTPASAVPPATATLQLSASSSAVGGTYSISVTASSGSLVRSAAASLTVPQSASTSTPVGSALPPALPPSTGTTFYVAPNGSDANPGTLAQPWLTVQKALNTLQAGETALVRGGTYAQSLRAARSGTASAPITISNYPGETAVIAATPGVTCNYAIELASVAYVRVHGLVLTGASGCDNTTDVYVSGSSNHVEISGNEIRGSHDHGLFSDSTSHDIQILGNLFHDNGTSDTTNQDHAIYVEGKNQLIANNIIRDQTHGWGIQVYPNSDGVLIVDNTIVRCYLGGIIVGGNGTTLANNTTIVANVVAFNTKYGIRGYYPSAGGSLPVGNVAYGNVVYGNPSGDTANDRAGIIDFSGGNVTADPLFVNLSASDLHVGASSPALDRARAEYSDPSDFEGRGRPQGAGPDVGAYERG